MKNYFLLLTLGAFLLTATNALAQKKTATSTKKTASTSGPALTKATAGKIIDMTNCVVDIYNEQLREMKDIRECLERFENTLESVAENPNRTAHGASCSNINMLRADYIRKLETAASAAPSFPEKAEILSGIERANAEYQTVKTRCEAVQNYFKTKGYLEDDKDYSKYVALRDTFMNSYNNIRQIFGKTMDLASQSGDRAEVFLLKSSPVASVIVPMKTNLSAVSRLMSKCREEEPNIADITSQIAEIRKMITKDKVATPAIKTALNKLQNGESRFERFYNYEEDVMKKTEAF